MIRHISFLFFYSLQIMKMPKPAVQKASPPANYSTRTKGEGLCFGGKTYHTKDCLLLTVLFRATESFQKEILAYLYIIFKILFS